MNLAMPIDLAAAYNLRVCSGACSTAPRKPAHTRHCVIARFIGCPRQPVGPGCATAYAEMSWDSYPGRKALPAAGQPGISVEEEGANHVNEHGPHHEDARRLRG